MLIDDRFTRGLFAGIIAGLITKIYDLSAYYLHFSTLRWLDVAGTLVYGHRPTNLGEAIFASFATLFFHALLGVLFVYLIQRITTSDNLMLKGWFYGVAWWFAIYAIIMLFKMPEILNIPLKTSLSNLLGASIWGLVLAKSIGWLDIKSKV